MTYESNQIAMLDQAEIATLVLPEPYQSWCGTTTDYPRDKSVAQLFEETVAAQPDAVAVVFGGKQLSYQELNKSANRLAHHLRRMGVGPETMVGCCIDRSPELIVALIAILKAGGAYVPLDPTYPKERFDLLLEETRTSIVLTTRPLSSTVLAGRDLISVLVDEPLPTATASDDVNPLPAGGPRSLAYVMFTSGSTGRPKGVLIENRSIVRLVRNTNYCEFGPQYTHLLFAPISFDASTLEVWGALLNGGRLVVMQPQTSSLKDLAGTIRSQGVTTLWLTSGLFNLMVEQHLADLQGVQQLLAGGDVLSARHVRMVLENLPDCRLVNGYGPTENTTFTCCHSMHPGDVVPDSVPLGRPISNTQVYILNQQLQPALAGEVGELYCAGDGLARGYLNSPSTTAEKFVSNPFVDDPRAMMYRTGDLARWSQNGTIDFRGRVDNQVKILGHRIEPGEIETVLAQHAGVQQACVVSQGDEVGSKRLVAYYVAAHSSGTSAAELKNYLSGKLPHYMVPAFFVSLTTMPLSPNGKVDRTALPAPTIGTEAPRPADGTSSPLEETLKTLWKRALQVAQIGLDDNFFDLGADSLTIVSVHSKLQKTLEREIPVTDLFEFTTIRTLTNHLGQEKKDPSFSEMQLQAQRQREAFARQRERRGGSSL
jgi:amino acid adenylation domain-containing protein